MSETRFDKELVALLSNVEADQKEKVIESARKELESKLKKIGIKVIPPRKLLFAFVTKKFLEPEEVCVSLERDEEYEYITLWFRFPYDKYQGDGPEYEPITIVLKNDELIEVQTRVHWRIVHIDKDALYSEPSVSLFTTFSAHGHTPIPILKAEFAKEEFFGYLEEGSDKQIKKVLVERFGTFWDGVSARWLKSKLIKVSKEFVDNKKRFPVLDLFDLKLLFRMYPEKIKRNPMLKPWYSRPVFG